jgi:hypothetical protein
MIDEGIPGEWPPAVISAVMAFQQGDLVRDPPFIYVAAPRHAVWDHSRPSLDDEEVEQDTIELVAESGSLYGMIATETCDLTEEDRPYRKHPWFSLAPVYAAPEAIGDYTLGLIKGGRYSYLRSITDSALGDGTWIVDARILVPVEKSWLVGKIPIRIYSDSERLTEVADFFANRFRRVDLDKRLHEALIKPLRRWLEQLSLARLTDVMGNVMEVRLAVSGDPLNPDGASLILIVDDKSNIEKVKMEWDRKWDNWRGRAEKVGIALIQNSYETYDSLSARSYRESLPIDTSFN